MANVLIFTGAGCSHPIGLPLTTGFQSIIDNSGGPHGLSSILREYLGENYGDIEHVLSTLEFFSDQNSLLKFLLKNKAKNDGNYGAVNENVNLLRDSAKNMIVDIKGGIFNLLKEFDEDKAGELYFGLISECKNFFNECSLSLFTANYDLTFETAIDNKIAEFEKIGIESYDFGFVSNHRNSSIFDPSKKYIWNKSTIEYKKIHGSLDWILDRGKCLMAGAYDQPKNPSAKLLLYPGFKGTPTTEPFKSLHDQLLVRLTESNIIITIGFAFRDPYINNIFDTALKINPNLIILCYNPCEIDKLPKESSIPSFIRLYPHNFCYVKNRIDIDSTPLYLHELMDSLKASNDKRELFTALRQLINEDYYKKML